MPFAERFVSGEPRRLAAAVRPWGTGSLALAFAGGPYRIVGLTPAQEAALYQHFGSFCAADMGEPSAPALEVLQISPEVFRKLDTRGWELTFDFDYGSSEVWLVSIGVVACMERGRRPRARLWTPVVAGQEFHGAVENLLRVLCAYRLLAAGGLLLHSAGVIVGDLARVFVGGAGAGKSTFCAQAGQRGLAIVSDDLNAVSFEGGVPVVMPVPFAGDFRSSGSGENGSRRPLGTVGRLVKAPADGVRRLSRAAAFASLVAHAPYVNHDPVMQPRLLEVADRITSRCPAFELSFTRAGRIVDLLAGAEWGPS